MKKLTIITAIILCSVITAIAQIILENTYPPNTVSFYQEFHSIKLKNSGNKYVALNTASNTLTLYNLDHSTFKTVNLNIPNGTSSYAVLYISENLFDLDDSLEYMLSGVLNNNYYVHIYDEDGALLWEETDCNPGCILNFETIPAASFGPIMNTSNGTKMVIHTNVTNFDLSTGSIKVYGLPGSLITGKKGLEIYDGEVPVHMQIYPNPSSTNATIEYTLPKGEGSGEIIIFTLYGEEVKRITVSASNTTVQLDNSMLSAGTYLYQLVTQTGPLGTKKMVVVK